MKTRSGGFALSSNEKDVMDLLIETPSTKIDACKLLGIKEQCFRYCIRQLKGYGVKINTSQKPGSGIFIYSIPEGKGNDKPKLSQDEASIESDLQSVVFALAVAMKKIIPKKSRDTTKLIIVREATKIFVGDGYNDVYFMMLPDLIFADKERQCERLELI